MTKKTIGIIGGMGPLATCDLFKKIITNTPAACDQDHIHVIIDNNTNIPDRTAALLAGGPSPLPEMVKSAQRLEAAGADALIMPCNTAHGFYEPLQEAVSIPVIHMIRETVGTMVRSGITCAGLLATSGTIEAGVYDRPCTAGLRGAEPRAEAHTGTSLRLLKPTEDEQKAVMHMIYQGVKAGVKDYDASAVQAIADRLISEGAQAIILGCTELPLAKEMYALDFPSVDPTEELARAAVRVACGVDAV